MSTTHDEDDITPTLESAIEKLQCFKEFAVFEEFLATWREQCFRDMRDAGNPHDTMKLAGTIATLSEILDLLD